MSINNLKLCNGLLSCRIPNVLRVARRYRYKEKKELAVVEKKNSAKNKALDHFDDFYKSVYGKRWPSIRIALLSPHKYCAVINNFGDTETTITNLENQGAINIKKLIKIEEEKLKTKKTERQRKKDLDRIFKLADEDITHANEQKESSENLTELAEDVVEDSQGQSLASDLQHTRIDEQRLVDPSIGLNAATLHEFVPATRLKGMDDYVPESQHYGYYQQTTDFPISVEQENSLNFPDHLNVFCYERGNITSFPQPKRGSTGALNYFLMNGSSLLPVLALDLQPGDAVLDMCSAPGGKALLATQTLHPGYLVCNDIQESRVKRIHDLFSQYLHDFKLWEERLLITRSDGRDISEMDLYDKILVDVPCTTDRHSVTEEDNNIFKVSRVKERLRLPELQAQLLSNALKLVKVGGCVVYATCSLSPIQNDGVVHMALRTIWEETKIGLQVRDMSAALLPLSCVFRFGRNVGLRYGQLVVPFLPSNFGPLYFSKIIRTA